MMGGTKPISKGRTAEAIIEALSAEAKPLGNGKDVIETLTLHSAQLAIVYLINLMQKSNEALTNNEKKAALAQYQTRLKLALVALDSGELQQGTTMIKLLQPPLILESSKYKLCDIKDTPNIAAQLQNALSVKHSLDVLHKRFSDPYSAQKQINIPGSGSVDMRSAIKALHQQQTQNKMGNVTDMALLAGPLNTIARNTASDRELQNAFQSIATILLKSPLPVPEALSPALHPTQRLSHKPTFSKTSTAGSRRLSGSSVSSKGSGSSFTAHGGPKRGGNGRIF